MAIAAFRESVIALSSFADRSSKSARKGAQNWVPRLDSPSLRFRVAINLTKEERSSPFDYPKPMINGLCAVRWRHVTCRSPDDIIVECPFTIVYREVKTHQLPVGSTQLALAGPTFICWLGFQSSWIVDKAGRLSDVDGNVRETPTHGWLNAELDKWITPVVKI